MRRSYTRKRNKINLKDNNKRALIVISILIVFIVAFLFIYFYFIQNYFIKRSLEKEYINLSTLNENTTYALEKITIFSSATATSNEVNNSVWNLNISQYADIAINLKTLNVEQDNLSNIQKLYIDHIVISNFEYGTPYLYQKALSDFGKCTFSEELIEGNSIEFTILPESSDETPIHTIDSQLLTPITLGYYNKNVKENFLNADTTLEYNGKLLKRASIPTMSIKSNLSFDIHLINDKNEEYICNISIDIPFEDGENSIYEDGYLIKEIGHLENYKFLRIR